MKSNIALMSLAAVLGLAPGLARAGDTNSFKDWTVVCDCGNSSKWLWTDQALALSEATVMPVRRGYGYDWPVVFRAPVR